MNHNPRLSGIHHITAITASAAENVFFYQEVLGLRLVKQTVNFDDPHTYHLYYGDAAGSPGTILTFFPWERLPQGKPGRGLVSAIALAVPHVGFDYWVDRIERSGMAVGTIERFGERVLQFRDPHGLPLELVASSSSGVYWPQGGVPRHAAITGIHSATELLGQSDEIRALLTEVMGFEQVAMEGNRQRFEMGGNAAAGYYDIVIDPQAGPGRSGSGSVHHIAFRTADDMTQAAWQTILRNRGFSVSEVRDRNYFRSIYFDSPGGVLFEIATDVPGFAVDETPDRLGSELKLPARYEPLRQDIEAHLPPLGETARYNNVN